MTFDFTYGKHSYRYAEDNYIYKIHTLHDIKKVMPVPVWLIEVVEGEDRDLAVHYLRTLLHGYTYGTAAGKKALANEFKTLFHIT